jgi:hypothetical protein
MREEEVRRTVHTNEPMNVGEKRRGNLKRAKAKLRVEGELGNGN